MVTIVRNDCEQSVLGATRPALLSKHNCRIGSVAISIVRERSNVFGELTEIGQASI